MSEPPIFPLVSPITVGTICDLVPGVLEVRGSLQVEIVALSALKHARPGCMAFSRFKGAAAGEDILSSPASVVVTSEPLPEQEERCFLRVEDPRGWFIKAMNALIAQHPPSGIDQSAQIAPDVMLGNGVSIGAHAVIEAGAIIGDGSRLGPFVHITGGATIGRDVAIQSHSVVGSTGLAFHEPAEGSRQFFPHLGRAVIEDGVSIGTHSTIVRGILEHTVVGPNTVIGNFVNIGHNCFIGAGCFVSSGSVLTGGVRLFDGATLAAGVHVASHKSLGENAIVGIGSVVTKDVENEERVFGNPARPLPTMRKF